MMLPESNAACQQWTGRTGEDARAYIGLLFSLYQKVCQRLQRISAFSEAVE
jgi:hypothetical protein